MEKRPDLKRVESERSAQLKSVSMAKGSLAPRLNVFGSWEEDSHAVGWTGANNWIAGAELQFDLFERRQQASGPGPRESAGGKSNGGAGWISGCDPAGSPQGLLRVRRCAAAG